MFNYAVTVKKTRGTPVLSDYESYLSWLGERVVIYDVNYEFTRGMHIHFIISSATKLERKDPSLYRDRYGWNILALPIYNVEGWRRYIYKDSQTEDVLRLKWEKQIEELAMEAPPSRSVYPPDYGRKESPTVSTIREEYESQSDLISSLNTRRIV